MTTFYQAIKKYTRNIDNHEVRVCKIDKKKQIVYGEVYAPDIIDTHGHAMDKDEIEQLAHRFLIEAKNAHIDLMHNNQPVLASTVESFIARKGDPDFSEGAWVLGTKIFDPDLWKEIESGKYNGYSMEVYVNRTTKDVRLQIQNQLFGVTEENDGHDHVYYVEMNDDGVVVGGRTSKDAGHYHEIQMATATEINKDHAHRFLLP